MGADEPRARATPGPIREVGLDFGKVRVRRVSETRPIPSLTDDCLRLEGSGQWRGGGLREGVERGGRGGTQLVKLPR